MALKAVFPGASADCDHLYSLMKVVFPWTTIAREVYDKYLARPYTLKSHYGQEDWIRRFNHVTIHRPNHGLAHVLRTALYASLVIKIYNFFHKTEISRREKREIQFALLFYVAGRENEESFGNPNYQKFREKSAEFFEAYIREKKPFIFYDDSKKTFLEEKLQFYKQAILNAYSKEDHCYIIIRICHDLDLLRCYTREDYSNRALGQISRYIGPYFLQKLARTAELCLEKTGDRIALESDYNGPVFVKCSRNIPECLSKIYEACKSAKKEVKEELLRLEHPPKMTSSQYRISFDPEERKPWKISSDLFKQVKDSPKQKTFSLCEVTEANPSEFRFVRDYFWFSKPPNYGIKKIFCIHNPTQTASFENWIESMENQANNDFFASKGKEEEPKSERAKVIARWKKMVELFSPITIRKSSNRLDTYKEVKVLPLWHGSSEEKCRSICDAGFTVSGKHGLLNPELKEGKDPNTDLGYFGSGIYFTNSAEYALKYCDKKSSTRYLLLSWVSMREPYPVVNDVPHPGKGSDMKKLEGKEAYQRYNAHYIPVASIRPHNPGCMEYYPCYKDQPPAWDELVVFHGSQTLPRFWVELTPDSPEPVLPLDISEIIKIMEESPKSNQCGINGIDLSKISLKKTVNGHLGAISSIAHNYSYNETDYKLLIATGSKLNVKIWDESGESLGSITGFERELNAIEFIFTDKNREGKYHLKLITGHHDCKIRIWDIFGINLGVLEGHTQPIYALLGLDNKNFVSGSADNKIKIWDAIEQKCLATLDGHSNTVSALCGFRSGLTFIASGSWDKKIKLWYLTYDSSFAANYFGTLEGHSAEISALIYCRNNILASASWDGTIKIWDLLKKTCIRTLEGHSARVNAIDLMFGILIVSGSSDKTVRIWNLLTGECLKILTDPTDEVLTLTCYGDSSTIMCGLKNGSLMTWNYNV